jgi:hypothetical protein
MERESAALQHRLRLAAVALLVVGLCASALIYLTAEDGPESAASYAIVDGTAYPMAPGSSKVYVRDLQRFGGKAAVLFDELSRWFAGLWEGRSLGVTIACLSVAASIALFLFAESLPADDRKSGGEHL